MNEQCPHCHNIVVGRFSPSDTRKWLTSLAKKGGMKAVLTAVGSVVPGFGNISGFLAGTAIDVIYGKDINKIVDKAADAFEDKKIFVFECPNCGHTWTHTAQTGGDLSVSLTSDDIFDRVEKILVERLVVDEDKVYLEAELMSDLGADSLDAVEIIMDIEKEFDIDIPDADAKKMRTVEDITLYIQNILGVEDDDEENDEDYDDENPISLCCDGFIAEQDGDLQKALYYYIKAGEWGADDVIRIRKMIADNLQSSSSTSTKPLQDNAVSDIESEYVDEVKACFEDGGEISKGERRLLEKIRIKLGITEERAAELEQSVTAPQLTEDEQEYLAEYRECLDEKAEISAGERRLLNRLRDKLGISEERASELEQIG